MDISFDIQCELQYAVSGTSEFFFNVQAAESAQQRIAREDVVISGVRGYTEEVDPFYGNRYIRATADGGPVELRYSTRLAVSYFTMPHTEVQEVDVGRLPIEVLPFVLPSRYCQSDRFVQLATDQFGSQPRGFQRVEAVCDWVHRHVRFVPGTTNSQTSAADVWIQGTGVCRDFAHVTIALLRALNIPARFVTGYDYGVDPIWGPTDFHAYIEAFLGRRWWIFDSSRLCPRNGLVRIGTGRDAADVAFATIFGPVRYSAMKLDIVPVDGVAVVDDQSLALSTAQLDTFDHLRVIASPLPCAVAA